MAKRNMNREQWLTELMTALLPMFEQHHKGATKQAHKWRVSCGWPGGRSAHTTIGQCWHAESSKDKRVEMFISPKLDTAENVGHVLVHEMCHAAVGSGHGHKGPFVKLARALGLEGKPTATHAGPELAKRLNALYRKLGKYPHAAVTPGSHAKKQSTRLLKLECGGCGYIVRTTAKWVETGVPTCCCGEEFELA